MLDIRARIIDRRIEILDGVEINRDTASDDVIQTLEINKCWGASQLVELPTVLPSLRKCNNTVRAK